MSKESKVQAPEQQGMPVDPRQEKEANSYILGLMEIAHGKKTRTQVIEMLRSAPPEQSVPQAAILINDKMEKATAKKGLPSFNVLMNGFSYLVTDLLAMVDAGGFHEITEETIVNSLQQTFQMYIQKGLKDGSLDPMELQAAVEPLLNEDQRALGLAAGQKTGVPSEPGVEHAMESYGNQRVSQERKKMASQQATQRQAGAQKLQQGAMAQAAAQRRS